MKEVTDDLTMYKGVRLAELITAIYEQGKKDGARSAIQAMDEKMAEVKSSISHRNPGQPKKKKEKKEKKRKG